MKLLFMAAMIFAQSTFAMDLGDLQGQEAKITEQLKTKAQGVMAACKEDKVKYCDKYNQIDALKDCLQKNKESLSAGCKASMGLK